MKTILVLSIVVLFGGGACRASQSLADHAAAPAKAVVSLDAGPDPAAAEDAREFLLHLLDVSSRQDASAWGSLQSQNLRARDRESPPLASLRMQAWASALRPLEAAIRSGRVFLGSSGGRNVIKLEEPGKPETAAAFVSVEDGHIRLDEN